MAARKRTDVCPNRRPRSKLRSEAYLNDHKSNFGSNKALLALKSAKIARLLEKNPEEDVDRVIHDIPADEETMELVMRFCHGFEISLTAENVVRVVCVAHCLEMTDSHCGGNLLNKALLFLERRIFPSWISSIRALRNAECVLEQAVELDLINWCVESIVSKALDDPRLLGDPMLDDDHLEDLHGYKVDARRKLFDADWRIEDLTALSLVLYSPVIHAMAKRGVPPEYIAVNVCNYARKWMFSDEKTGLGASVYRMSSKREMVEGLASLLPLKRGVVPCSFLIQMLRSAVSVDCSAECRNSLEVMIGKQLNWASVEDLLVCCRGYAEGECYDTDCMRRVLKYFYGNYTSRDPSGLILVAELMDEFLMEVAGDLDLKISIFVELANMSVAASSGSNRTSDGIYRAIDMYLDKHQHLTESEREELCKVLDYDKLSDEARRHATQNERLPVRTVVQMLFASQLKLIEATPRDIRVPARVDEVDGASTMIKVDKIGSKVLKLEREWNEMKREIGKGHKLNIWMAVKRKFSCGSSTNMHDLNHHIKKKQKSTSKIVSNSRRV